MLHLISIANASETSFEDASAGPVGTGGAGVTTEVGTWSAEAGHARIDDEHARTGSNCLHVVGGEARTVELALPEGVPVHSFAFWAERWTGRDPFELGVDERVGDAWRPIDLGGVEVVIGGFHTRVAAAVDPSADRLRIICTSPSGVLIDDVRLGLAVPMELEGVAVERPAVPLLVGRGENPLARVTITTRGGLKPLSVREVRVSLAGTTRLADLESLRLEAVGGATLGRAVGPAVGVVLDGALTLAEGENVLTVSARVAAGADLDHRVVATVTSITLSDGTELAPDPGVGPPQRLGLALRDGGDDDVGVYRIPGIVTTPNGTLIAVYDARWSGWADLPGDVDVGMSRSTDGGRTWEPMRIICDMGNDPDFRHDGVGDPAVLVDRETGTIWVAAVWSHGDRGWHGSGPGLEPEETGQLVLVRSDDDGVTWSEPINITREVKDPAWCYLLQGPGRGITMRDGTLVFAAQFQDTPENDRMPHSTILYSRDHGETWELGTGAKPNTTEAQVVELEDGVLMLNMRDNRGGARSVSVTRDLGRTWEEHPTSRKALVEPVCNAGLIAVGGENLLFVNPAVARAPRRRMTLKASTDRGRTWPEERAVLLDEGQSAGYPSLTRIDEETVGVLFEGSRAQLTFVRVRVGELGL